MKAFGGYAAVCFSLAASLAALGGCEFVVPLDDYVGESVTVDASTSEGADAPVDGISLDQGKQMPVRESGLSDGPTTSARDADLVDTRTDGTSPAPPESGVNLESGVVPETGTGADVQRDAVSEDARVADARLDASSHDAKVEAAATPDACGTAGCGPVVSSIGCSDESREGFLSLVAFPQIAGCRANWLAGSLRTVGTGAACGNTLGIRCSVPADACSKGWHVCATPPYGGADVRSKVSVDDCLAQKGEFAAAIGDQVCEPCSLDGSGAACCGDGCVQQNGSCIYPGQTAWFGVIDEHMNRCADIVAAYSNQGVLCCRDPI